MERKISIFGSGSTNPNGYFTFGPHGELVGKRIDEVPIGQSTSIEIKKDQNLVFKDIDLETIYLKPSFISGVVSGDNISTRFLL